MENVVHNISGHIHSRAGGFFEKYFETTEWAITARASSNLLPDINTNSKSSLWGCLEAIQETHPDRLRSWYATFIDSKGLSSQLLHPDFYLSRPTSSPTPGRLEWTQVQVIGDFCDGQAGTYRDSLLRLCEQARQVFKAQPTRLFLHAFHVFQDIVEPWVFDRSGMYSGDPIDLRADQSRFKICLSGYQLMDDTELGANAFIRTDASGSYILSSESDASPLDRLDLEETPITSLDQIVGNGIAVYRAKRTGAKRWELAVKFKWQVPETGPVNWPGEERMLRLVKERSVWGVAQIFSCHALDSIVALREGLRFDAPRDLVTSEDWEEKRGANPTGNRSSAQKHQHHSRSRAIDMTVGTNILGITKPASSDVDTESGGNRFTDRTLSCLIVSPLGRPLGEFNDIPQLLDAIIDAIKGHKDLYNKGILHQDVSVWNVMIVEGRKEDTDPRGMLIDLDLALELQSVFPDGRSCAGTPMFMAIEVLHSKHHTYRHDLESFLYVLLWTAVCNKSDQLPENSRLQEWRSHDNDQLAATKTYDMGLEGFQNILDEFDVGFQDIKPLAWKLRKILFRTGTEHGPLWTGTDEGESAMEKMYAEIVDAFVSSAACYRGRALEKGLEEKE